MSDELEQKRQEKIANFKLQINDDINDDYIPTTEPSQVLAVEESMDIKSDSTPDIDESKSDVEFIMDMKNHKSDFDDISSGEQESENPYSEAEPEEQTLDSATLKRAKKADRRRSRQKAKKNRVMFRIVWLVMVIFVSIVLGQFIMVGVNDLLAVGREQDKKVTVTIPKDASLDDIANTLYDNGVINNKGFFKFYATMTHATSGFTQGSFEIETNKDYQALVNYLQSDMNRTDVVTLQFTEGMTVLDFAKKLEDGKVCSADDFLTKCNSSDFDEDYDFIKSIKNANKRYYKLEGYLFPDTYDFYVGEDTDDVIRKFLANYRRKMYLTKSRAEGFEKKVTIEERAKKLNMSMEDVLTLASLIQAEAANEEDMYMISSILHNRLATLKTDGMNEHGEGGLSYLQLDSTLYYPYASENDVPIAQRNSYISDYSTYKYKGLPAGPICNPSLAAITAAVSPQETDYYYFCHKAASGDQPAVAYYAKTNSEHLQNLVEAGLATNTGNNEE